jgi:hypothetical protein
MIDLNNEASLSSSASLSCRSISVMTTADTHERRKAIILEELKATGEELSPQVSLYVMLCSNGYRQSQDDIIYNAEQISKMRFTCGPHSFR